MGRTLVTTQHAGSVAIFGLYDIRGRYPTDFSPASCRRIADAFLSATTGSFVVARDVRRASERLERVIGDRLQERGRALVRLGIQPTPMVGFASGHLGVTGLAFTPSHNALGYAGIKAFGPTGRSLGREWDRIRSAFVQPRPPLRVRGSLAGRKIPGAQAAIAASGLVRAYLSHVTHGLRTSQSVVVDSRGGATTRLAPRALTRSGAFVTELHPRFSADFHRLSPEPKREDVGELGRRVRARRADLGIAFDGDGDRVVFVDERGRWVEPEVIGMLLYRNLSPPGRPLVVSVDVSQRCEAKVATVRSRVGSRYVTAAMLRHRSSVGFEASSHFYLERWGPNSDGILIACAVCHFLDQERTSLGELSRAFGRVVRDREMVHFATRAEAVRCYREITASAALQLEKGIDGVVFRAPEGSVLLRLSNTQPAIRILLEPNEGQDLSKLRRTWKRVLSNHNDLRPPERGYRPSPAREEPQRPR